MAQYEIKDVVCDYGLYEDGELKLILNSAHNAHIIKRILEIDQSVPNVATPADFVEVVRCEKCKDFEPHGNGKAGICRNKKCKGLRYATDFCSYGERKEK